ncbi:hypothetical protein VIGAN_04174500 [Vigna angularis var. angularis]|uniref:Uncharacterized protein n=1 Tax=Vigna angularis var. angularis TaxID=157739 RepID=A0A0S3RUV2_PHAAN|nr:hypothetical protein VIGAN_04174500 [Vigna angularis var. angularis]
MIFSLICLNSSFLVMWKIMFDILFLVQLAEQKMNIQLVSAGGPSYAVELGRPDRKVSTKLCVRHLYLILISKTIFS